MGHTIRVDDDVWDRLEKKALELGKPYESRNAILRMILGLPPSEKRLQKDSRRSRERRVAPRPVSSRGRPQTR